MWPCQFRKSLQFLPLSTRDSTTGLHFRAPQPSWKEPTQAKRISLKNSAVRKVESSTRFEPPAPPGATTALVHLCNEKFHPPFLWELVAHWKWKEQRPRSTDRDLEIQSLGVALPSLFPSHASVSSHVKLMIPLKYEIHF